MGKSAKTLVLVIVIVSVLVVVQFLVSCFKYMDVEEMDLVMPIPVSS